MHLSQKQEVRGIMNKNHEILGNWSSAEGGLVPVAERFKLSGPKQNKMVQQSNAFAYLVVTRLTPGGTVFNSSALLMPTSSGHVRVSSLQMQQETRGTLQHVHSS